MDDSIRSAQNFDSLWAAFKSTPDPALRPDFGLLPDLALDAVLARYKQGELLCIPRIVELVCTGSLSVAESAEAVQLLDLKPLSSIQRRCLEAALDRWWLLTISVPSDETPTQVGSVSVSSATDTLGILAGFDAPMRRWLHVWLENFDGLGASLFVEAVLGHRDGTSTSLAWSGKQDEWSQFQAWCRAEPTVMGFTLVGGVHVDAEDVTAVFEQLV